MGKFIVFVMLFCFGSLSGQTLVPGTEYSDPKVFTASNNVALNINSSFKIGGSSTKKVKVKRIYVSGTGTVAASVTANITAKLCRTTTATAGTLVATNVGKKSNFVDSPTATPQFYSTLPAYGAFTTIQAIQLHSPWNHIAAARTLPILQELHNSYGTPDRDIILKGPADILFFNLVPLAGVTTTALWITVEWVEL